MADPIRWPFVVRDRLGDDGVGALLAAQREWKEEVLITATDRYERRLVEEAGRLRDDVRSLSSELLAAEARLRGEMAGARVDVLKWSFAFWLGQIVSVGGLLALMR
jgi:hypothetical protein